MDAIEIVINGQAYPCRPTMGAMLRYKRETGKEVTEINATSPTDLVTYLWCCVVSACKHDGKAFDLDLVDFADSIMPSDLESWAAAVRGDGPEGDNVDEKKSSRQ